MIARSRPFDDSCDDFAKMWCFLQEDYAARKDHFVWLFSRLGDWKYGLWNEKKYIPSFFRDQAQLWLDPFDQLLGFMLSEDGGNVFFIFTRHGHDYLYADILDWTIQHWGPCYVTLKTEVHEYQSAALAQLGQRAFRSAGIVATTRAYDLTQLAYAESRLAPGFRIVTMAENTEYRSKALLYVNGFEGKTQVSEFELLRFAYSRESPAYDPAFDFSVVTAAGMHVATCVGFHDPTHRVAEIEKICTHQDYRRQGLAEAVVRECMYRLKHRGIERAYITGYGEEANALYEKLEPCTRKRWFHYELT